jgi:hypothetical protein
MRRATQTEEENMRRKKRLSIFRIAVALAATAAILPVAALAKPHAGPTYDVQSKYEIGTGEIPYMSQGHGVDQAQLGRQLGSDDRALLRTSVVSEPDVVIPYMSQGKGVTSAELGFVVGNAADDRPFARSNPETTPVTSDGGWSIDVNPYLMTGSALILLALGMGFALWYTRRTRLTPA